VVRLREWRRSGAEPSEEDRLREAAFLDQHIDGGALIHTATAEALAASLDEERDEAQRARLALRLFAEYVNALETLGAWGWSIRNRRTSRLLMDAFLSYAPGDVRRFYEIVTSHTGELSDLLGLPSTQTITDELRSRGVPHGPLLAEFTRAEKNLVQAAQHYFRPDESFVTNYNKAKHGAPIIRDARLKPDEFYVIAPEPLGTVRYLYSKFSSSPESTAKTVKLTQQASNTTRALVSLARNLNTAGLLYSDAAS
jgi:hypothetical protein